MTSSFNRKPLEPARQHCAHQTIEHATTYAQSLRITVFKAVY
jgi:hypothetical protein